MDKNYNPNVVDVDALEKVRLHEEAETERTLIKEQELTKRAKEETKRNPKVVEGKTNLYMAVAFVLFFANSYGA